MSQFDAKRTDVDGRDGRPALLLRIISRPFWEEKAASGSERWNAFLRDVFLRPSIGIVGGLVLGGLLALVVWLTIVWAPDAAQRAAQGEAAARDAITPEGGWAAIFLVGLLALVAGWEQVVAGWLDALRQRLRPLLRRLPRLSPPRSDATQEVGGWRGAAETPKRSLGERAVWLARLLLYTPVFALRLAATLFGFVLRIPSRALSLIDWFLARVLAPFVGAARRGWFLRYAIFIGVIGGAFAAGLLLTPDRLAALGLPGGLSLAALVFAMLAIIAVARRWSWVERDRDAFLITRKDDSGEDRVLDRSLRLGFTEDLRDEALTGLVALFALIPLALMQIEMIWPATFDIETAPQRPLTLAGFDLFDWTLEGTFGVTAVDNPLSWYAYFGAELAKSVPFVDWSEVFHVPNGMPIKPGDGALGPSVVFGLRAGLDLLVLAAVLQALTIAGRTRQVRGAFDNDRIDVLDPFDQRLYFSRAERGRVNSPGAREIDQPGVLEFTANFNRDRLLQLAKGEGFGASGAFARPAHMAAMAIAARRFGRRVQDDAAEGEGGWAETDVVEALAERLEGRESDIVRRRALTLCGEIGLLKKEQRGRLGAAAAAVLADRRASAEIRAFAAREIGRLGAAAETDRLASVAAERRIDPSVMASCSVALAKLRDGRAAGLLETLPEDGKLGAMRAHGLDQLDDGARLRLPETRPIPAGAFMMGSPEEEPERDASEGPRHSRRIAAFELGRFAVMFDDYLAYCALSGAEEPGDRGWGKGRRPVINVSWNDAQAYVGWLTDVTGERWRLPSEAEWEYACRAGSDAPFSWGETISTDQANYDGNRGYAGGSPTGLNRAQTVEVDAFEPNDFCLHQMHGNVWEWCQDQGVASYREVPDDESARVSGRDFAVLRGGSWSNYPFRLRSAYRYRSYRRDRIVTIGFRVARTAVE